MYKVCNRKGCKMTNFLIFRKTNKNSMHKYAQGKSDTIWNWLFSFTWFLSPFSNITENMFSISARSTSDVRKIEHICRKNKEGKSTMWSNLVWSWIKFLHCLQIHGMFFYSLDLGYLINTWQMFNLATDTITAADYGRPVRKLSSLHGPKTKSQSQIYR